MQFYSWQLLIRSLNFDELNIALGKQNIYREVKKQVISAMVDT